MPKALIWFTGIIGISQLLLVLSYFFWNQSADNSEIRFETAQRCVETISQTSLNTDSITNMLDTQTIPPDSCWQTVFLPDRHPADGLTVNYNDAKLLKISYHLTFTIPQNWPTDTQLIVYAPRILASVWQLKVNNHPIADNRKTWRSTWLHPLALTVDEHIVTDKKLDIDLTIFASKTEGYALSRVSISDAQAQHNYQSLWKYFQIIFPKAQGISVFLMGFYFLSSWLTRRAEPEYLILAFVGFLLSIVFCQYIIDYQPTAPQLDAWYHALISDSAIPWLNWLSFLFAARYGNFASPLWTSVLWFNALVLNAVTLSPLSLKYDLSILKAIESCLFNAVSIGIISWHAALSKNNGLRIIAMTYIIMLAFGLHDIALILGLISPENYLLSPFGLLFIFGGYLYVVQLRHIVTIIRQEQLNRALNEQLTEKDKQAHLLILKETVMWNQQSRLLDYERAQTIAEERQRLMHDIHDGLGSSLLTTLVAVEKQSLSQSDVAESIRSCIDDLRFIIDSLEPHAQDVVSLLATIRYRLDQRLLAAGLTLDWQINDLPPLLWLEPSDALNLLRFIQESLVNVLKHAKANRLTVSTALLGSSIEIVIKDNGCGYDTATVVMGRGTPGQFKRAHRLGGMLTIDSIFEKGTTVRLVLPINKKSSSTL